MDPHSFNTTSSAHRGAFNNVTGGSIGSGQPSSSFTVGLRPGPQPQHHVGTGPSQQHPSAKPFKLNPEAAVFVPAKLPTKALSKEEARRDREREDWAIMMEG